MERKIRIDHEWKQYKCRRGIHSAENIGRKTLRDFSFQEKLNTDENPVRRIKKYILH